MVRAHGSNESVTHDSSVGRGGQKVLRRHVGVCESYVYRGATEVRVVCMNTLQG